MSALFFCLLLRALCAGGGALKGFRPCAGCGRALPCTRDFFGKKSSKNFITPAGGTEGCLAIKCENCLAGNGVSLRSGSFFGFYIRFEMLAASAIAGAESRYHNAAYLAQICPLKLNRSRE